MGEVTERASIPSRTACRTDRRSRRSGRSRRRCCAACARRRAGVRTRAPPRPRARSPAADLLHRSLQALPVVALERVEISARVPRERAFGEVDHAGATGRSRTHLAPDPLVRADVGADGNWQVATSTTATPESVPQRGALPPRDSLLGAARPLTLRIIACHQAGDSTAHVGRITRRQPCSPRAASEPLAVGSERHCPQALEVI